MKYTARRIGYLLSIVLVVTFLVSSMLELMPGDPAISILGESASPEQIAAVHERLGLDKPVYERYGTWLGNAVKGDLGRSSRGEIPVTTLLRERAPVTLQLVVGAQMLALLYAAPTAIYGAHRRRGAVDASTRGFSFALVSVPHFVLAQFVVIVFAVTFKWFPVAGYSAFSDGVVENLKTMALPTIVIAAAPAGVYQRLLRAELGATLQQDFISMAEAKGQSTARVLFRHALRPSLFSLITLIATTTGHAIGGSVVVEVFFGLPGLGRLLIDSITANDVIVVQGVVAVVALCYILLNTAADVLYGVIDPRVRRHAR